MEGWRGEEGSERRDGGRVVMDSNQGEICMIAWYCTGTEFGLGDWDIILYDRTGQKRKASGLIFPSLRLCVLWIFRLVLA